MYSDSVWLHNAHSPKITDEINKAGGKSRHEIKVRYCITSLIQPREQGASRFLTSSTEYLQGWIHLFILYKYCRVVRRPGRTCSLTLSGPYMQLSHVRPDHV